jgi:hypothetical protein
MHPNAENKFWQYDTNYWIQKLNTSHNGLWQTEAKQDIRKSINQKKLRVVF